MSNQRGSPKMRRRDFLVISAASVGGLLVYSLDRQLTRVAAQNAAPSIRVPLRFFTRSEALLIASVASRIIPSDESGPGANEAGVVIYIDRQLAGPWGRDRHRYTQPPFDENAAPEFGYQGKASPREIYREALKNLAGFDHLPPAGQDQKLKLVETTRFFELIRRNTIEGMFCDPIHGGNADMLGWQMIGFPGPQMSWTTEVDKHYGEAFRPKPMSLSDVLPGRKIKTSEDELT